MTNKQQIYYDGAILNLAKGFAAAGFTPENAASIEEVFTVSPELITILENPGIASEQKKTIIDKIFHCSIEQKCLKYLIDHQAINSLDKILEASKDVFLQQNNIAQAKLSYAKEPPNQEQLKSMEEIILSHTCCNSVNWTFVHSPDLLDGFILESNGKFYDYSLNGSFNKLLNHLNRR